MKEYKEFEYYWTNGKRIIFKPDLLKYEIDNNNYEIIKA